MTDIDMGASDVHNNGQYTIIVRLKGHKKIVFKPREPINEEFLIALSDLINGEDDVYNISVPQIIKTSGEYFWSEYIEHKQYETREALENFFTNAGSILALMDVLNYSDGHNENFIAGDNHKLVLIDPETIFVNLSYFKENGCDFYYDLRFTGMIETKRSEDDFYLSALQSSGDNFIQPMAIRIEDDLTDNLSIKYKQVKKNIYIKNSPFHTDGDPRDYKEPIIKGLEHMYDVLAKNKEDIKALVYKYSEKLVLRQIKRHTLYYSWLYHRMLHPLNGDIKEFLDEKLFFYSDEIASYESISLYRGDIPIFYHKLSEKHLYGYKAEILARDYFSQSAYEWFLKKLDDIHKPSFRKKRRQEVERVL